MRFAILGPLEVRTDDGKPVPVPEKKVRALLARFLTDPGRAVPASRLIADLWDGHPPADPAAALHTKVSLLRRALAPTTIERVGDAYRLAARPGDTDAGRFTDLTARAARATGTERADLLERALDLWRGPAFAEFHALAAPAAALEERRLAAREALLAIRLDLGRTEGVLAEAAALAERHPRRERLHAAHLRALYLDGRHGDALEAHKAFRERLADDGLEPGRELQELHRAILRHDPALVPAPSPSGSSFAAPITPLIGRGAELDRLVGDLADARLTTLTGPGGVGKTRLALAAARRLAPGFTDGAWLIELGALGGDADAEQLAAAIADAMGLTQGTGTPAARAATAPSALVRAALAGKRTLLVLDNCEHLAAAAADTCRDLLASEGVRVLATSREPLRLPGEQVTPLGPLGLPAPAASSVADIAEADAVRLFTDRATAADQSFTLTDGNATAVAAVCRQLDGLPLALELAATRVKALGVERLAAELADRLLATEARGLPERQRSLRAVIDWSWELLDRHERLVLGRLATTCNGARIDEITGMCAADLDAPTTVDALASLADKSLVEVTGTDERRYRLLTSVAVYCRDRLSDAGELERAARSHRDVYTALAAGASDALRGPDQCRMLDLLDDESANLHAALETSLQLGEADAALRLTVGLTWYWFLRSHLVEGRRAYEAALALDGPTEGDLRAAARFWHSSFTVMTSKDLHREANQDLKLAGAITDPYRRAHAELFTASTLVGFDEFETSEQLVTTVREQFADSGDQWGMAASEANLAWYALLRGDMLRVHELGTRSWARFSELGDAWGELQAIEPLAVHAELTGDYAQAGRLNKEGLELAESLGLRLEEAYRLGRIGRVEMLDGNPDQARRLFNRAYEMGVEQSVPFCQMFAETGLMLLDRRTGRLDEAERVARSWISRITDVPGLHGSVAMLVDELGFIAEMRGDADESLRLHLDSLRGHRGRDARAVAMSLEGLAGAWSLLECPHRAARALGCAAVLRERSGAPLPRGQRFDVDRIEARLIESLGRSVFEIELDKGRDTDPSAYLD